MTEASSPSLPAIRERQTKAQAAICAVSREGDRAFRMSIPPHPDDTDMLLMAVVREDVPALLSLVARLQGERESARTALQEVALTSERCRNLGCDASGPGLTPQDAYDAFNDILRAARAALGEE